MKNSIKSAFFNEENLRLIQQGSAKGASYVRPINDADSTKFFDSEITQAISTQVSIQEDREQSQWEYNYPHMTMHMSPIVMLDQPNVARQQANVVGHEQYEKARGSKGFFKYFFLTLLICACIAAVVAFVTYELNLWGGVFVPNVNGKILEQAKSELQNAGFEVELRPTKSDDNINIVFSSNPGQGKKALSNSKVFLYYFAQRTIPNVAGMNLESAKRKLNNDGYTYISVEKVNSSATDNSVIEVSPSEGTAAKSSIRIKLKVAQSTNMPYVVGKSVQEARSILTSRGIKVRVEYELSTTKASGIVIRSYPSAGKVVNTNYSVTIVVA
ncbi:MAG: PASTA domain-containing protein, partial [Eggerthellaceae bacterium]|nr:PASTA domain-containing protein [Eggerthellaceae bacterium]